MINAKQAVLIARGYLSDILFPEKLSDVRLEEVEIQDDGNWYVTLGFNRAEVSNDNSIVHQLFNPKREYKIVKIDGDTGDVRAMRMRTPA